MKIQRSKILMQSIVALLALTATHRQAQAGQVWDGDGADGLWSNSLNWDGNTLPSFGVPLQFDGALQLTSINDLTATVSGVTFNSGAEAFTLTGAGVGDSVTLNGGVLNISLSPQTVAFGGITLGSAQTFRAEAALTVSSAIQLGANTLTVDTVGAGSIELNGEISGTGGLMKTGDGVLTLNGSNTQSGPTLILTGVVAIGLGESLSPNSDVTIQGGILDLKGNSPTIGALKDGGSSNGSLTNSTASAVVVTLGNNNGTGSFSGLIENGGTGGVGLVKVGSGSQTLSGANTYTGPTTVNGGTLIAGVASVPGFSGAFGIDSAVTLGNIAGAKIDITGFATRIGSLTGGGLLGGNIILGAATLTVGGDGTSPEAPFGGVLIGTGGLLKIGDGTLGLSGANLYSGVTTIDGGTLQSGAANSFSPSSEISLALGSVLDLAGHNNVIQALNGLGGTVRNSGSDSVNFTVGSGGGSGTFAGLIEDGVGSFSVIKVGSGAQTFSGGNTYGGGTTLQAGQLFAETDTALGSGALTMSGGTTFGSSTDNRTIANSLILTSPTDSFTFSANTHLSFTGDVTLANGTNTISGLTGNAEIKFAGAIGGSGSVTYSSPVDYTAFIIGNALGSDVANTYTGLTTVNDRVYLVLNKGGGGSKAVPGDVIQNGTGSLDFFLPDQISDTASVTINGPGNLLGSDLYAGLQLNNHNETIGSLFGATTGKVQLGSATLTVGAGNFPGTIANGFSGVGGQLVKNTSGTLVLSGANTYTGNTSVSGGILEVAGSLTSPVMEVTGGSLIVGKTGGLSATSTVNVASGAGFEYHATTATPLTIGALSLSPGVGTTIGGSIGSSLDGAKIVVTGSVTPGAGDIAVNVFGIPGVATGISGVYTLLTAGVGSNLTAATYSLGNVYNATNFTVSAVGATPTTITATIASVLPLTDAFWVGGLAGSPSVWSASNGSTASNWGSTSTGTATPLVPGEGTSVFFSAITTLQSPNSMTLGANMEIGNLTINGVSAPEARAVTLENSGGHTLTLAGVGGLTIASGAGAVTLNPNIVLGASQTWANNSSNLLTVGGNILNGASVLTVTGSGDATFTGVVGGGSGGVIKSGVGVLSLSGANTYAGGTQLSAGTIFADTNTALGSGALRVTGPSTLGSRVTGTTLSNAISLESNLSLVAPAGGTHDLVFGGAIDLNNSTRVVTGLTHQGQFHFSGVMSNGGLTLTTAGLPGPVAGDNSYVAFIFDGASPTYAGLTTVEANAFMVLQSAAEKIRGNLLIQGSGVVDYLGFSNQIADTASVTVNSPGSTILGGMAFAGLELRDLSDTIGALFGSSVGTVGLGSGTLTVGAGDFSGVIRDGTVGAGVGGQLVKNTSGVLTLSGANTYTGNTSVNNGQLVLNGSVESPNIFVNFSGTLSGTGTAMHNVRNAGVFSPGNSPGTFRIRGNYTQTGAGTMVIETTGTANGSNDLVQVTGTATLDGGLRLVKLGSGVLKVGDKATFLTAVGGVSGKFANVTNGLADTGTIVQTEVVYGSNSVELLAVQGSYELFAQQFLLTPNQLAVAGMLDAVTASASQPALIDYLNAQALADLPGDFDLIAPDELQAIYTIGMSQANVQTANLQRRMEGIRAGREGFSAEGLSVSGTTPPFLADARPGSSGDAGPPEVVSKEVRAPSERRLNTFVTGSGEYSRVGESGGANGYNLTTGGFTLGVDYKFSEHFSAGINTGFARTTSKGLDSTKVTVDGAKLGAYGTYYTGEGFYADGSIQGGYSNYDTQRTALLGTARGTTNGAEVNALIATGFDFTTDALRIGPVASFQYTHVGFANYQESGSLAPLDYGSQSADSLRSAIGMKATYEYRTHGILIRPEMRAAWQHEFGDVQYAISSSLVGGGPAFIVQGAEIGRESLLLGVGVSVLWNERASTYLYYDGELGRTNYSSNNISGGVRLEF